MSCKHEWFDNHGLKAVQCNKENCFAVADADYINQLEDKLEQSRKWALALDDIVDIINEKAHKYLNDDDVHDIAKIAHVALDPGCSCSICEEQSKDKE